MGVEERSLRVYNTQRTFFSKLGTSFSKLLTPTQAGINNLILNIKRNAMIKNFINTQKIRGNDSSSEKKFEETYSLYLEAIDRFVVETIYKKVKINKADEFEKEALSKYYNIIHLKENDEIEYKYKKQQYLLDLDMSYLKHSHKGKVFENFKKVYLYEMEQLYKGLLKRYSIKLTEKMTLIEKEACYERLFETLENYVRDILPMKKIEDEDIIKAYSLYETYEVGKLDQIDILDKKMILLGISRKLFIHSLPLVVSERCYIKLLKDVRNLIVDTKIIRKRELAYQLLLKMFEEYNKKLLSVKIYWKNNDDRKAYNLFTKKLNQIEKLKNKQKENYEIQKQILFIKNDEKALKKYGNKYYRILQFYKKKLEELGYILTISKVKTMNGKFKLVKGIKKLEKINEKAC